MWALEQEPFTPTSEKRALDQMLPCDTMLLGQTQRRESGLPHRNVSGVAQVHMPNATAMPFPSVNWRFKPQV